MTIPRNVALLIHHVLDQWLPPIVRDSKWFMSLLMRVSLGRDYTLLRDFKDQLNGMSSDDLQQYYARSRSVHLDRETDLNNGCVEKIRRSIAGESVLDIACGRGYLTKELAQEYTVTGADFVLDKSLQHDLSGVRWEQADIESLPFEDDRFDTVICAHTLEHVVDINSAISELRRVAKKKLIVVLPRQRPYQYTFDLHVHFFPYRWQVLIALRPEIRAAVSLCESIGGDWYYEEVY